MFFIFTLNWELYVVERVFFLQQIKTFLIILSYTKGDAIKQTFKKDESA